MMILNRFKASSNIATFIMSYMLICVGIVECVIGCLQLFGFVKCVNAHFAVVGTFYNPGPFGCLLGAILPVAVYCCIKSENKILKAVSYCYILLAVFLLPGNMSRTGWLSALIGISIVVYGRYKNDIKKWRKSRLLIAVALICASVSVVAYMAYIIKMDSADGRFFLWKIATRTVQSAPIFGAGWENVAGVYGDAQESYFGTNLGTLREEYLAGCPEYVFNEYLQFSIAFGIWAGIALFVVLTATCVLYWRNHEYGLSGAVAALMVTCMASYPFQFIEFRIPALLLVVCALWYLKNKYMKISLIVIFITIGTLFIENTYTPSVRDDFHKAMVERNCCNYKESNEILFSIIKKSCDPMPLNIIGRNYQSLGMRDSAEHYFVRASNRVPNRLYPHYLLMKLYAEDSRDSVKLVTEAKTVYTKRPKVESSAADDMKEEALKILQKYNIDLGSE